MAEIARLTGLPISTAHRLMTELTSRRFLERTRGGQYRVGLALRMIGTVDACPPSITERAPCVLDDIPPQSEPCPSRSTAGNRGSLHREDTGASAGDIFSSGATLPAHPTAMGRALLAFSPAHTVTRTIEKGLHSYTAHTVTSPDRLRHALTVIRLTRVAITHPELEPGVYAVAMPIFGPGGRVVAAIELALRNLVQDLPPAVAALTIASRSLSRNSQQGTGRRSHDGRGRGPPANPEPDPVPQRAFEPGILQTRPTARTT